MEIRELIRLSVGVRMWLSEFLFLWHYQGLFFEASGITIAKRAMRGVDSEGMICSKGELGINEDEEHHWIWNLGVDLDVSIDDL